MLYVRYWMERFFTSVTLTLFDPYGLRGTVVFHPVEVYVKAGDLLEAFRGLHELCIPQ